MRHHIVAVVACLCSASVIISAVPLPANNQELDVLQIPLANGKELDVLTLSAQDQEQIIAERNKRTIGLLRELFPDITKQIDGIVNRIIAQVIRVAGPSLLPSLLGQNRPTTDRSSFDAGFDDDDDDDEDTKDESSNDINTNNVSPSGNNGVSIGTRINIDLPTFPPESTEDNGIATSTSATNKR